MANGSTADKAAKARAKANDAKVFYYDSQNIANKVAKSATGKDLTTNEATRAGKIVQARRVLDTGKTAARATAIAKREAKKAAAKRLEAAVSGGTKAKATPKPKAKATKTKTK
jgi:hypothetical protein